MTQPARPVHKPKRLSSREAAEEIVRTLQQAGFAAYFAGGCVRDRLLGREPADYDIATSATPADIARLFKRTRAVGQHFGVMLVLLGGQQIEVATFRTDMDYQDGRRPESVRFSTPQEDAQRRDFTINGLFFDPVKSEVVDYVDGQADLQAGLLRAIGDPAHRFAEDHLRLLRAVRFAARFDLEIEAHTWSAMIKVGGNLAGVSPERILEELEKIAAIGGAPLSASAPLNVSPLDVSPLTAARVRRGIGEITGETPVPQPQGGKARALQLIHDGGLSTSVMPEYGPFERHLPLAVSILSRLPSPAPLELMLAGWLGTARTEPFGPATKDESQALAKLAEKAGLRLRMSNRLSSDLAWLLKNLGALSGELELADQRLLRADAQWPNLKTLALARLDVTHDPAAVVRANIEVAERYGSAQEAKPAPLVSGDLLIARGMTPGPKMGEVLAEVYRAQLNERIKTVEEGWAMADRISRAPADTSRKITIDAGQ